jgi:hypothetical protein
MPPDAAVEIKAECDGCGKAVIKRGATCAAAQRAFARAGWYVEWWLNNNPHPVGVMVCRDCYKGLTEGQRQALPPKMEGIGVIILPEE